MDPDDQLARILARARRLTAAAPANPEAVQMAHDILDLDDWLTRGGRTPVGWALAAGTRRSR